jgi:hypothetical protein
MALEQITVEYNLALEKAKAQFDGFVRQLTAKEAEIAASSKKSSELIIVDLTKVQRERKRLLEQTAADTKKAEDAAAKAVKETTVKITEEERKRNEAHKNTERQKVSETTRSEQQIVNVTKKASQQIIMTEALALKKRLQFIKEEKEDLIELQQRKKLAYTPEEIQQYNKAIADTQNRIKTLNGDTGTLANTNGNLITSFRSIAAAVGIAFSVQQLLSFGSELLDIARKSQGVSKAFNNIASSQDLANLRTSTGFGVSDLQLKQLTVRANAFKISLDTLPKLLQFATIRAAETGEEVDYLVRSIIDGIGRKSTLVIDNLGIGAAELQEEFRRTGDFAAAVGNIIDREMGKSVTSIEDAVTSTQKLAASWANTKEQIAPLLANFLTPGLEALNNGIKDATNTLGGFKTSVDEITQALQIFGAGRMNIESITKAYERFGIVNGEVIEKITKLREITDTANISYNGLRETVNGFTKDTEFAVLISDLQQRVLAFQQAGKTTSEAYLVLRTSLQLVGDEYTKFITKTNEPTKLTETLESLNAQLKNLKDLFETTDINAPAFRQLQMEIKALEERIESIVNPTNKGSIAYFEKELAKLEDRLKNETSIQRIQDLQQEIFLLGVRIQALKNLDLNLNLETDNSLPAGIDEANKAAIRLIDSLKLLNDTQLKDLDKQLKDMRTTLDGLANTVTEDLWEEFKAGIDDARQKQEEFNQILIGSVTGLVTDLTGLFNAIGAKQDEAINRQLEGERNRAEEHFAIMQDIWKQQVENGQLTNEELFNNETAYREKLNQLEARQLELRKQQLRKAAIAEKANASFQVIVGAAAAAGKNLGNIPALIAIGAAAAAQLAIIAATPIPEFAKGVVALQGKGTGTSDDIPAMLSKGESVITAKATSQHKGALEAMNKGEYEKYVQQKYIVPMLVQKKEKQQNSFAENIARSMQQQGYDDSMLVHETRKNRRVNIANADQIGRATAREMNRNSYFKNRV